MSDIATWARNYRLEVAWAVFSAANLVAMLVVPNWATVPFHLVWVSLTILYGLHVWTIRVTSIVLAIVVVTTGVIIGLETIWYHENIDEISEVPLMAAMFVAMVWHARRHKAAVELVQQMVQKERYMRTSEEAFVRTASHELRTPITVAHGHAELARRVQTNPDAIADLDLVIEELDHLGTLSSRLLMLAAVNATTFLAAQEVDVDELIVALGRRWVPTATRRWQFESSAAGTIRADPERVGAALDALIENAVKFTDGTDEIAVRAEPSGVDVRFVVNDTGAGITPDLAPRVFDAFARADFGDHQHTGGTGLGLAIVKAIAEAHGGTVEVTSERGVGSTFVMCLPRRGPIVGSTMLSTDAEFGPDAVHRHRL